MRILLLGGSKSGKSALAQGLTKALARGGPMYYWATMTPVDGEDLRRVARHLEDRAGWGFETVEWGRRLADGPDLPENASVLFDSVTALLANEMFGAVMDEKAPERALEELLALSRKPAHFVCVCDDLFRDAGNYNPWTERYRAGLAHICRGLAAEFQTVCEVSAGLPKLHKGSLPK